MELILADNPVLGRLQQQFMVLVGTGRRLQTVDVSRSGLTQVPAALTRSIRTLQLAGNSVTTIRCGDLDSYPLLQLLNLADNQLEELEEDALGRLEVLSTLYLSGNHLVIIPRSLPSGLITLHLQRNHIQQLNSSDLQGLPHLKHLSLCCSGITVIQNGAFSQLTALETLDISENPLKSLPGNALSGPLMSVLRLSHLGGIISSASDATEMSFPVTSPERLEVLDLESSPALAHQLLADTAALAAFRQLRELNLISTGLTNLRSDLFHFLPRLRTLRLNGNQWECEGMLWLANWVRQQQKHQQQELETSLQGAYCASPPHLTSTPVIQLRDADFNITTNNNNGSSTIFFTPVESNTYEATTEARYAASVSRKMFSVFRIHNTQIPDNKEPSTEDPLHKKYTAFTKHPAPSIGPFTDMNRSTTTLDTAALSPINVISTIPTTTPHKTSSTANNAYTTPSTLTGSEEFIFNTTIYEGDLITNMYSTNSSVTNRSPDNDVDFKSVNYTDTTTSGTFLINQIPNNSNIHSMLATTKTRTVISPAGDSTKQTQIMFPTIPKFKPHVKEMNITVHDDKTVFTDKNSMQGTHKSPHHIGNVTTVQNQNISSKTVNKFVGTNITNFETRKTYINNPSNSTKTLFINKPWAQHKFFPNSKNKNFLPNNEPLQSAHSNLNVHKLISNHIKNDTVLPQEFSNKDLQKFKHYQGNSFKKIMQGDETLNADSEGNKTSDNNNPMEASIFNKTSEKYNYDSSDFRNQSANKTANDMKFGYYMVMKHEAINTSTNHSNPNSKIQPKIPLHSSVHNSVHRNHSTKIPTGFYTNKPKLADRNNSESFGKVVPQHRNATSSDVNYSGNISYINMQEKSDSSTGHSTNITSLLEGENLVFENVTLSTGDVSVFYSSRASDTFASGAHVTVKENISTSLVSGSHPSMFVLLGVGLAMAVAFAMAMSHCANRRRRQAVEYSRQQDIEVRSMSSIGDLW
jgi:Leucine-rich repeat (LRR) protein